MYFQKKINNNFAWALDGDEHVIVGGKGISFNKKVNQKIADSQIERVFRPEELKQDSQVVGKSFEDIDPQVLTLTQELTKRVQERLKNVDFNNSHFLALADHLDYALKRGANTDYPENLRWEVRKTYPEEYDAALDSLYFIEQQTGIRLPKSELTFLTYHYVDAQSNNDIGQEQSAKLAELTNRAIEIVQYHYQLILDQNSANYVRFVTHLRFFILRQMHHGKEPVSQVDPQLLAIVKQNYQKAYQAAQQVGEMLTEKIACQVSQEELFYLTLHIDRVTRRQ
ncbi:PRD domain-containing protein [Lactobacillus sp. ESL0684]|uniref:PRD domain-containing protein n=1 Tax=unclassified Lactobacillus TaxID=2620435 RepID=UPI0023F8CD17|nr:MULTISPECIES: PRD domain-containing protein [unclassified Lactobacillus]WEV39548.1 PRD domain-containing protein [Lactobacillus sp. ESL0681]WEV43936.1 PRD domain-containing protein [Lactobacillus sp. ESL0684]